MSEEKNSKEKLARKIEIKERMLESIINVMIGLEDTMQNEKEDLEIEGGEKFFNECKKEFEYFKENYLNKAISDYQNQISSIQDEIKKY